MRLVLPLFFALVLAPPAGAVMVFLDLNDAPKEIEACREGTMWKNNSNPTDSPDDPQRNVYVATPRAGVSAKVALREKIKELQARGLEVDGLVISGESGGGSVWGENGTLKASDLAAIKDEVPGLNIQSVAMPACYTGTRANSLDYWVNENTGIPLGMNYVIQSPSKERQNNLDTLRFHCASRDRAVGYQQADRLCDLAHWIRDNYGRTANSYCDKNGVYSAEYDSEDANDRVDDPLCHSSEELQRRCQNFVDRTGNSDGSVNKSSWRGVFERMMEGDPSLGPFREEEWKDKGKKSPGRLAYDEAQKWRHCQEELSQSPIRDADGNPLTFPEPGTFLFAIKFDWLKENVGRANAAELADYDKRLRELGLENETLGDVSGLPRQEIVKRTRRAVAKLAAMSRGEAAPEEAEEASPKTDDAADPEGGFFDFSDESLGRAPKKSVAKAQPASYKGGGSDPARVLHMAKCIERALVDLEPRCTPYKAATKEGAGIRSSCIQSYGKSPPWSSDDDKCIPGK